MKFEDRYQKVDVSCSTDAALKFAGAGFGIVPGLGWNKSDRINAKKKEEHGGMGHPLYGIEVLDWMSQPRVKRKDPYYLALAPVGDDPADVLTVLDIDNHGADGNTPVAFDTLVESVEKWFCDLGCEDALNTLVVRSPADGLHMLFFAEETLGFAWSIEMICDALPAGCRVDWLTADGGRHLTGPECDRPNHGLYRLYAPAGEPTDDLKTLVKPMPDALIRWCIQAALPTHENRIERLFAGGSKIGAAGLEESFAYRRALKFDRISDLIRRKQKPRKKTTEEASQVVGLSEDGTPTLYAQHDVVSSGGRHNAAVSFAGTAVNRCAGATYEATLDMIRSEVEAFCQKRCEPPLPVSETNAIVRDAMEWAEQAREKIEARIRSRVVVIDSDGGRAVQVSTDFAEREVNGARYRCKVGRKGKVGMPIACVYNVSQALAHDKDIGGRFGYDVMACRPIVTQPLPWDDPDAEFPRFVTDEDRNKCIRHIDATAGFNPRADFAAAFSAACHDNNVNPLKELVLSFAEGWDGEYGHIARLIADWMGVGSDDIIDGKSFSGAVMELWMRAAIRRALHPGCKVDLVPILTGGQGIGKTTFWSRLAIKPELLCESLTDIRDDKKSFEQISPSWIVIIDELAAMRSAQAVTRVKTWLTATADDYRAPYTRDSERVPRHVVFAGTTNELTFLSDRSGNRRFACIPVIGVLDPERGIPRLVDDPQFEVDVRQAWCEAYALEKEHPGEALVLPRWAVEEQERRNADSMIDDPWTEPVAQYLEFHRYDSAPICYEQVFCTIQNATPEEYRTYRHIKSFQDAVRRVAADAGWTYGRYRGTYGSEDGERRLARGFMPPEMTADEKQQLVEAERRSEELARQFEADEEVWTGQEVLLDD